MAENDSKHTPQEEKATKLEVIITILLGTATILGALAAYFSALWGGEQQSNYTKSLAETNKANTIYLDAINDLTSLQMSDMKDDLIYSEWKQHVEKGDPDAQYYFIKLSEGLQKDLLDDPADVSEYEKEQAENLEVIQKRLNESEDNLKKADEIMQKGQDANRYSDDFTLCTVLFTIVLFFLGIASLKTKESIQKTYVIIAVIVLLLSLIKMVTIPFPQI